MAHQVALLRGELSDLRKANEALTKRKSRKRKYIQLGGSLTLDEASQLISPEAAGAQEVGEEPLEGVRPAPGLRRCGRCGQPGHNVRTCQIESSDSEESA